MVATTGTSDPTRGRMPGTAEPLLIDQFLPDYDLAIVFSRVFRAPPERCLETSWTPTSSRFPCSGC
jgi:hypothetical protein